MKTFSKLKKGDFLYYVEGIKNIIKLKIRYIREDPNYVNIVGSPFNGRNFKGGPSMSFRIEKSCYNSWHAHHLFISQSPKFPDSPEEVNMVERAFKSIHIKAHNSDYRRY